MAEYTIREGQTVLDVALQLYGDVTKALDICKLNEGLTLISKNIAGTVINYEPQSNQVTNFYKTNNIVLTSRYPEFTTGKGFSSGFNKGFN